MPDKKTIRPKTLYRLYEAALFRMVVPETVRIRYMPNAGRDAAESWLQRRLEHGQMQSSLLCQQRVFYRITSRTLRLLNGAGFQLGRSSLKPLGAEPKRLYFAYSMYCNESPEQLRHHYRPYLDGERFPRITEQYTASNKNPFRQKLFFRDGETVGQFFLDRGQRNFVAKKIRPRVFSLLSPAKYPEFHHLATEGNFRIVVATANQTRHNIIKREFEALKPPFPYQVIEIPELRQFPPPRFTRRTSKPKGD